ncbi:acetolactate synthase large subunit [Tabrizicola piscis]|uniref:Acetolactate synthase large subunit n=1 Tax=Tabrizicola piscis TaxID=2494374 RepID=A0A3S8U7B4_9RHOB|nr:acetolactate synthase large subunit [Tabrizicola piscis]AZL59491.1 acetolactate synthase large subunit [Tabrizicola piscis]
MNGAETLVKTLLASGVRVCFANPGTSEMHFVAALDRHPDMRCILCLFEGGVSGAADGFYRMSGEVSATLLHLAPGFGNAFANLHNARKAQSGVVNIMGDHADYHLRFEAPLKGDTVGISRTVSHWTRVCAEPGRVAGDAAEAVQAARGKNGQIATLILPANMAWDAAEGYAVAPPPPRLQRPSAEEIAAAARALRQPGAVLLVDGPVLWSDLGLLAKRLTKAAGARLMQPFFVSRFRRGAGAVKIERMAYRIEDNLNLMAGAPALVLCGTTRPAGFFAYPNLPSTPDDPDTRLIDLCTREMDIEWTLQALAAEIGEAELGPEDFMPPDHPALPEGPLTLASVGEAIAALMPDDSIVVDEGISASSHLAPGLKRARGHDALTITGGSIGFGLPNAVGAAVACPDRKVVVLEGDGSGMYTLQSLWTMAREGLDVTVVIFANRGYQILRDELAAVGVTEVGRNVVRMFDVVEPTLDWVALAKGHGVAGVRVTDMAGFNAAFAEAMGQRGPRLIEVVC